MKVNTLKIRGEKLPAAASGKEVDDYSAPEVYKIIPITRGDSTTVDIGLRDTDIVEFEFDDGTVWMSRPDNMEEVFPEMAFKTRGESPGTFELPTELSTETQERGVIKDIALKIVRVFTKKKVIAPIIKELAGKLEDKQLGEKRGLLQLSADFTIDTPKPQLPDHSEKPYLLFIHGTASSTEGSFSSVQGSIFWQTICHDTQYERVLAYQHESLTKSPLQNVLELVKSLPQQATLVLVTQSRGGIVGDILSRFCVPGVAQRGFSSDERNYLQKNGRQEDVKLIEKIESAILAKQIHIAKYIRVACPASGTTLASKRLDHLFNIIFNLLGLAIGSAANPIYVAFKNLLMAVVESKDDANALPGMEPQNPSSPFIKMLNNGLPEVPIDTPLIVIAGNAKVSLKWKALLVIASKLFYLGKNDLIVDTLSMFNGAKRADQRVQYFLDENPKVSHFNYFENDGTRDALLLAIQNPGDKLIPGFSWLTNRRTEEEIRFLGLEGGKLFRDEVSGQRPIVVLLPGIMGSGLSVNSNGVWINYFRFLTGGLMGLRFDEENNKNIKADSIIKTSYKKLADYLSTSYDVVTFAFDWRLQLNENARLLNMKLQELMRYKQPIKLVGHSMGGVLVRDFILQFPETWQKLNSTSDFKLLFLGSPLGGSFRIPYVLFGKDAIISKLDMIDRFHSMKELLSMFAKFPGILSLLPLTKDPENDFAKLSTWEKMARASDDPAWPLPDEDMLKEFGQYRDHILQHRANIDYSNAVYIAGRVRQDKDTPSGYRFNNGKLQFLATKDGDESVTWDSGIPEEMTRANKVYYSDVTHGALANEPGLFSAISEILVSGKTNLLKVSRPITRALEKEFAAKRAFDFDLSPEGVEMTLLGLDATPSFKTGEVPITVFVSNGDLAYATHPIYAGHFYGDGIMDAEKAINYHLDGELEKRLQLGLYPGEIGSSDILLTLKKGQEFKGAVIVGLGKQGYLTEYQLMRTMEQAATKYMTGYNSRMEKSHYFDYIDQLGISTLLIGSGFGGLSIESSMRAIVQGIQNANEKIRAIYDPAKTINHIEFVELYQDRALAASYALGRIEKDENRSLNIIWEKRKIKKLLGWRERLPIELNQDWWTRIVVRQQYEDVDNYRRKKKGMRFTISTNAAREEERLIGADSETVHQLLEEMSIKNSWSPELAKAIFELLIPNEFKEQVKRQSNLNWILDKDTAAFPWELLQDSTGKAMPLSVNAGMVRQLATGDYRVKISSVVEKTALVVGDPNLEKFYSQLEGAYKEGETVGDILTDRGFDTTTLLYKSAAEIMLALFSKSYKIIHLAGHGVFNSDPDKPSGMLIGKNAFLTTFEVSQMSTVPELVFVNCCYLGQMNPDAEQFYQSRYRLAANIGTELIEIGVKAVIVAGWAVDDAAALAFTERFYQAMFEGDSFGVATRKARKKIYDEFGHRSNTWGAFQCYGDPFYTLLGYERKAVKQYEFILSEEAEIELVNLSNKLNTGAYDTNKVANNIQQISDAIDHAGIRNGKITELEALLYSGLNMYDKAIDKFEKLLKEENATYSVRATEQYCNVRAKYYVTEVKKSGRKLSDIEVLMKKVISDMESLIGFSQTLERLNILASTYKRYALITGGRKKQTAYENAAMYYRQSYYDKSNDNLYYPLTNWLTIENALELAGLRKWGATLKNYTMPTKEEAIKMLQDELLRINKMSREEMDYWDLGAKVNITLCLMQVDPANTEVSKVMDDYKIVWDYAGHDGDLQTEVEQVAFIEDALSLIKGRKGKPILDKIATYKSFLTTLY